MTITVPLNHGQNCLIDPEDYHLVAGTKWRAAFRGSSYYVMRSVRRDGRSGAEYLHRLILNAPAGALVDHIDCNGLNNQRSNLRLCTQSQNQGNQRQKHGKYRGVSWHKATQKWAARISIYKRIVHLGLFDTAESAASAYDIAARLHFGEFARLNNSGIEIDPDRERALAMLVASYVRRET